jgi:hypothetical protein
LHNLRKFHDCCGIIEIPLLRHCGQGEVMIDEPYQRFPLLGRQLQTGRNALGE